MTFSETLDACVEKYKQIVKEKGEDSEEAKNLKKAINTADSVFTSVGFPSVWDKK